jgi:hypothetical protein
MAGTIVVDRIESDGSYASTINVASKVNFTGGMQIGGQDTTFAGMRNRIINGAMMIDQRNGGALVAGAAGNIYGVDRFNTGVFGSGTGRISAQQSNTVPSNSGFVKSLINTVTTADASPSQYYGYCLQQKIEGYNIADLMFGTANAKTITLSFWVRSSIVGTYVVTISNENTDRGYSATYTILQANTWEQKTITVVGDTTGTWYTTTNAGIILTWGLGGGTGRQAPSLNAWNSGAAGGYTITDATGCVDWIATNGATFLLTGVQLEKGSSATPFEYRQYGTELALCQRYFIQYQGDSGNAAGLMGYAESASSARFFASFPVAMRASPTTTLSGTARLQSGTTDSANFTSITSTSTMQTPFITCGFNVTTSNMTANAGGSFQFQANGSKLTFNAEL